MTRMAPEVFLLLLSLALSAAALSSVGCKWLPDVPQAPLLKGHFLSWPFGCPVVCSPGPHLLQAAAAGLLNQLLCVHLFPNVVSHIQRCLLEELGENSSTKLEAFQVCITQREHIGNVATSWMVVGFADAQPLNFIITWKKNAVPEAGGPTYAANIKTVGITTGL